MDHPGRIAGNRAGAYTSCMDFHGRGKPETILYPVRTIYSSEARRKVRMVLEDFQPDVCHLNNFHYQLTPSILLEIRKWERQTGHECGILYTAHDYQLVCPNHMCRNGDKNCVKCLGGQFVHCVKGRCIHGSWAKSLVGAAEGFFWKWMGVYGQMDTVICCSRFLKDRLDTNPVLAEKTVVIHNFCQPVEEKKTEKKEYILYFGRYSKEKGVKTLVEAAKRMPEAAFVFAGAGPLESLLEGIPNVKNVGFQTGEALERLIREARFTVCPSEWYENCPFSVIESQQYGTPVLGANIGGIPEVVWNGELFESGNLEDLVEKLRKMWRERGTKEGNPPFLSIEEYAKRIYPQAWGEEKETIWGRN